MLKKSVSHYNCCSLRDLGGHENLSKMEIQLAPKRHQPWSIKRRRRDFFQILMNFGKLVFCCFWRLAKGGPKETKTRDLGRAEIESCRQIIIQVGHLSSGSGRFGWFYIPLSGNAWHWPVPADFGAHWILNGSPKWAFLKKINIEWEKWGLRKGFEQTWFSIDFWCQNARPKMVTKEEVFSLYMLQFKRFSRSRQLMENGPPKCIPTSNKMGGHRVRLLRLCGGFLKYEMLMNFVIGKKLVKHLQN